MFKYLGGRESGRWTHIYVKVGMSQHVRLPFVVATPMFIVLGLLAWLKCAYDMCMMFKDVSRPQQHSLCYFGLSKGPLSTEMCRHHPASNTDVGHWPHL